MKPFHCFWVVKRNRINFAKVKSSFYKLTFRLAIHRYNNICSLCLSTSVYSEPILVKNFKWTLQKGNSLFTQFIDFHQSGDSKREKYHGSTVESGNESFNFRGPLGREGYGFFFRCNFLLIIILVLVKLENYYHL